MANLEDQELEKLSQSSVAISAYEIGQLQDKLHDWHIEKKGSVNQLYRDFNFENFQQALQFTNKVAELAETYNHHPAILTEWGRVQVRWWTHSVSGLHINDFIMAARTEKL
jgi:4a-hydroxytetrahydrobiopterin dehydratase